MDSSSSSRIGVDGDGKPVHINLLALADAHKPGAAESDDFLSVMGKPGSGKTTIQADRDSRCSG